MPSLLLPILPVMQHKGFLAVMIASLGYTPIADDTFGHFCSFNHYVLGHLTTQITQRKHFPVFLALYVIKVLLFTLS